MSSLDGIAVDDRYLYVTDDKGAVHALDKATGASAWKQDKLAQRTPGGPQIVGDYVAVVDAEGYVHLLDRNDGNLVGRVATDGTPATAQPAQSGRQRGVAEHRRDAPLGRRALSRADAARAAARDGRGSRRTRRRPSPCCPPSSSSGARTSASRRCSTG